MTIFYIWNWNCQSNCMLRPSPCVHPVQPAAYSNTGVWVPAYYCRNLYCWILPSADSFLLLCLCGLPASLSTKEVEHCHLMLHFIQLWQ